MNRRNWLDLSRKLVDRFDLDFTIDAIAQYLGEQALSFFGEGVLPTQLYPNPFPISMSGSVFGGTVGNGIAFDPNGQITEIPSSLGTSNAFTISTADGTFPRWDLLVLRYKSTGSIQVPKPSDPIDNIFLNLIDDFQIVVVPGAPGGTPAYPGKGALDIVIAGLHVPAGATVGSQVTVDLSIRELALPFRQVYPDFEEETPVGVIDGVNVVYTLSKMPLNQQSVFVFVDGGPAVFSNDYSVLGEVITMFTPLNAGQSIYVQYVTNLLSSPISGAQEVPFGVIDGVNRTFSLAGIPADQKSTRVYIDKGIVDRTNWQLLSGIPSQIVFNAGQQPVLGQQIYVEYFVGVATIGSGPSPVPVPVGSLASPVTFNPATGLVPGPGPNQIFFLKSSGGNQIVTAPLQIGPGAFIGQVITLRGINAVDTYTFQCPPGTSTRGLSFNGDVTVDNNQSVEMYWDGSQWYEQSRRS